MSSESLHEERTVLSPAKIEQHRAITSVMEELEAVDWYAQRVDASADAELKEILAHNRDEEKEHAAMVLEWLRRRDAKLDQHLRTYLFTTGPIVGIEAAATAAEAGAGGDACGGTLSIGSLREEVRR